MVFQFAKDRINSVNGHKYVHIAKFSPYELEHMVGVFAQSLRVNGRPQPAYQNLKCQLLRMPRGRPGCWSPQDPQKESTLDLNKFMFKDRKITAQGHMGHSDHVVHFGENVVSGTQGHMSHMVTLCFFLRKLGYRVRKWSHWWHGWRQLHWSHLYTGHAGHVGHVVFFLRKCIF